MNLRLFVALPVPANLSKPLSESKFSNKVRLSKEENYHMTLFFLGPTSEDFVPEIKARLEKLARGTSPFEIVGETVKLAPPAGPKTMVWFYFEKSEAFTSLAKRVYENVSEFTKETFKWDPIPHVTLARSKEKLTSEDVLEVPDLRGKRVLVNSLRLYRSQPSDKKSSYTVLAEFQLKNPSKRLT